MPSFKGDDGLSDAERIAYAVCNPVARVTRGKICPLCETFLAVSDSQSVCLSVLRSHANMQHASATIST